LKHETTKPLTFPDPNAFKTLLGDGDKNLRLIEKLAGIRITARGDKITLTGEAHSVDLVENLLGQICRLIQKGFPVYSTDIGFAHRILSENRSVRLEEIFLDKVYISSKKKGHHTQEHCPEAIHRRHPEIRHGLRDRPGGNGENLPGHGHGRIVSHGPTGSTGSFSQDPPSRPASGWGFCPGISWRR